MTENTVVVPASALKQKYVALYRIDATEAAQDGAKQALLKAGADEGLRQIGDFRVSEGFDHTYEPTMWITATFCPADLLT
jgi:hypothetical protein